MEDQDQAQQAQQARPLSPHDEVWQALQGVEMLPMVTRATDALKTMCDNYAAWMEQNVIWVDGVAHANPETLPTYTPVKVVPKTTKRTTKPKPRTPNKKGS